MVKTLILLPKRQQLLLLNRIGNKYTPEVVPPQQFKSDPVSGLVGLALSFIAFDLVVNPPGRDVAMSKPGAELGAVVSPQHAVAGLEVSCYEISVPEVVLEPLQSFCLTAMEAMHCLQHQ